MNPLKINNRVTIDISSNTFKLIEYDVVNTKIVSVSTLSLTERDLYSKEILAKIKKWCVTNIKDVQASVSVLLSLKEAIIHSPCMIKSFDAEEQLEWELSKYIGHSLEDYSWDYHILKEREGMKWATAVACRDSVLERVKQLFLLDKINLESVSIDIFGAMNLLNHNSKKYKDSLILSVYEEHLYLIETEDQQIDHVHWIPLSENVNRFNFSEKRKVLDDALEKMTSFLFKNHLNHSQNKITLLGDLSILPAFRKALSDHFSNPVETPSLDDIVLDSELANKKNLSKSGGIFCSAIGNNLVGEND